MARRPIGSGTVFQEGDRWIARIYLQSGKRRARKRRTEAEAELALDALFTEYADELGWSYSMPRPYYRTSRSDRPRAGVTSRVRFTILERDGYRCRYCGATAATDQLMVDHAISVADGGTDDPDNLVTACETCNLGKGSRSVAPPVPASPRLSLSTEALR